jgi:hypothetical protein
MLLPGIENFVGNIVVIYIKGRACKHVSFFWVCQNFALIKWSEFILPLIFKYLHFNWELYGKLCSDTHGSCLYAGKNEVSLLYNWLHMFRLSTSARNTEEQNPYQVSLRVNSYNFACFIHILLWWMYIIFLLFIPFLKYLIFALFYSVQYWTGKDYVQCSLYFYKIFYYFCYILFSMELMIKHIRFSMLILYLISLNYF